MWKRSIGAVHTKWHLGEKWWNDELICVIYNVLWRTFRKKIPVKNHLPKEFSLIDIWLFSFWNQSNSYYRKNILTTNLFKIKSLFEGYKKQFLSVLLMLQLFHFCTVFVYTFCLSFLLFSRFLSPNHSYIKIILSIFCSLNLKQRLSFWLQNRCLNLSNKVNETNKIKSRMIEKKHIAIKLGKKYWLMMR